MQRLDRLYEHFVPLNGNYREVLDRVHQHLLPRTYVEVGVCDGMTLTLALPGTVCIGIDPEPQVCYHLGRRTRVFSETSDDFFDNHDLDTLLGGVPLDMAFIDGMHHFEFALRDFINLERASSPSTTIFIHDCLPVDETTASRDRTTSVWSGDIWRLILILGRWRPDLEVSVIDRAPTGLGVVRGLDSGSTVLSDNYDSIVAEYMEVPYRVLDGSKDEQLNRVPGDWDTIQGLLPDQPFRRANIELLKAVRTVETARYARRLRSHLRRERSGGQMANAS